MPPGTGDGGVDCAEHAECDDGLFCNGPERCVEGLCAPGAPPCPEGTRCDEEPESCIDLCTGTADADGDGHDSIACGGADCDDADPNRFPGNAELCDPDGHDEDCNPATFGARDRDADGYPDAACCNGERCGTDCDDTDPGTHPAVPEVCGDGRDNDCDGATDEGGLLYLDLDNDGRGDPNESMEGACQAGYVSNADDCDDTRSETYGGAVPARERCDGRDNDCSLPGDMAGGLDPSEDADGDGHASPTAACLGRGEPAALGFEFLKDDCDDDDPNTYAGAPEICDDGIDQDCNRVIDDREQIICPDTDGDGHGDPRFVETIAECARPDGFVTVCDDCDDDAADTHPGHREWCDRIDNDCSQRTSRIAFDEDADGDGHAATGAACAQRGEAGVPDDAFVRDDCDDTDVRAYLGAPELCDGIDRDCSTGGGATTDEDADGDGFAPADVCEGGWPNGDCDDDDPLVRPGAPERCNGVDDDCQPATREVGLRCPDGAYCHPDATCGRGPVPVGLTSGSQHTCTWMANGNAYCWGNNIRGELGLGRTSAWSTPAQVILAEPIVHMVAGGTGTCAQLADGTLRCFGGNADGQLGLGTISPDESLAMPTVLPPVDNFALGISHGCAVVDNAVRCWGSNRQRQLGDGTRVSSVLPVSPLLSGEFTQVAAGALRAAALSAEGRIWAWGDTEDPVEVAGSVLATDVVVGFWHACVTDAGGQLHCWGDHTFGQLGLGPDASDEVASPTAVPGIDGVEAMALGAFHSCVSADGALACFGNNGGGQLGVGDTPPMASDPTAVPGLGYVSAVSAGDGHTCALDEVGVWCWGSNVRRQLGDGTTVDRRSVPGLVPALSVKATSVSAGRTHACARMSDGTARCWGTNDRGQLGDGTTESDRRPVVVVRNAGGAPLTGVVEIRANFASTCARLEDGSVHCWGSNTSGQLGDGSSADRPIPGPVDFSAFVATPVELSSGGATACVRLDDGTVACWGTNSHGTIGDGTRTQRNRPRATNPLTAPALAIDTGGLHSCAVLTDGTANCWGANHEGQTGDGTTTARRLSPVVVQMLTGATAIGTGARSTCALHGGLVSCWGAGALGRLGHGSTDSSLDPVGVVLSDDTRLASVDELAVGYHFACARTDTGAVYCWGDGLDGEIGDGASVARFHATPVPGLNGVISLSAGVGFACAVQDDGFVFCWGANDFGQLGDGTEVGRNTPSVVWDL